MHHDLEEHVFVPFLILHGANMSDRITKSHQQLVTRLKELLTDIQTLIAIDRASRPVAIADVSSKTKAFVADM